MVRIEVLRQLIGIVIWVLHRDVFHVLAAIIVVHSFSRREGQLATCFGIHVGIPSTGHATKPKTFQITSKIPALGSSATTTVVAALEIRMRGMLSLRVASFKAKIMWVLHK